MAQMRDDHWIAMAMAEFPYQAVILSVAAVIVLPAVIVAHHFGWLWAMLVPLFGPSVYSIFVGRCVLPGLTRLCKVPWVNIPVAMPYPKTRPEFLPDEERLPNVHDVVEAAYPDIRAELEAGLAAHPEAFSTQTHMAKAGDWKQLSILDLGGKTGRDAKTYPKTYAAMRAVGANIAFFSRLAAKGSISGHNGYSDGFWRCHLGLRVPAPAPGCALYVGDRLHGWEEGRLMCFNDAYYHWAKNDSDRERVVLIFDVVPEEFKASLWVVALCGRVMSATSALLAIGYPVIKYAAYHIPGVTVPSILLAACLIQLVSPAAAKKSSA